MAAFSVFAFKSILHSFYHWHVLPAAVGTIFFKPLQDFFNKISAVAEMGDRLATTDVG